MSSLGKALVVCGGVLVVVGLVVMLGGRFSWFGRLPGDIVIQKKGVTFFFPIATSLPVSLVLSAIIYLIGRK